MLMMKDGPKHLHCPLMVGCTIDQNPFLFHYIRVGPGPNKTSKHSSNKCWFPSFWIVLITIWLSYTRVPRATCAHPLTAEQTRSLTSFRNLSSDLKFNNQSVAINNVYIGVILTCSINQVIFPTTFSILSSITL